MTACNEKKSEELIEGVWLIDDTIGPGPGWHTKADGTTYTFSGEKGNNEMVIRTQAGEEFKAIYSIEDSIIKYRIVESDIQSEKEVIYMLKVKFPDKDHMILTQENFNEKLKRVK